MAKKSTKTKSRAKSKQNRWYKQNNLFRLTFVLAFAIAGVITILLSHAAPPIKSPLTFQDGISNSGKHIAQPVDWLTWCGDCVSTSYTSQNPWVTNPTTCMWDTDDWFEYVSSGGGLAAGASAGMKDCSYESTSGSDPNVSQHSVIHAAYTDITAPSPNLQVSETFSWAGGSHTFSFSSVFNTTTKRYDYRQCMFIDGVANGTWASIPDSNGGYGVPVTITATVVNPTSRSVSNIGGSIQYGWQQFGAAGCQTPSPFPPPLS
ncbi:MAG TPA: hypothetical protein VH234_01415 [Candidatus Saccharimonadales bacterium]|nr:hypothetical protein [Candidatus Saccharimonadales bacterium]